MQVEEIVFRGKKPKKNRRISLLDDYYYQTRSSVANQNAGFALVHQLDDTNTYDAMDQIFNLIDLKSLIIMFNYNLTNCLCFLFAIITTKPLYDRQRANKHRKWIYLLMQFNIHFNLKSRKFNRFCHCVSTFSN